jgi:sigma-B regulation protein RsbU (phosphoserine phosphatase)
LLVVDDVEGNREMLRRFLVRHGYVVDAAPGGREALEMVGRQRYDLVLLDVMMPEVGGYEVLKGIRENWSAAEMPVVMATVLEGSDEVVRALGLGANDYVTKPLDFPVVLARVRAQVSLVRMVREIRELKSDLEARNEQMTADLAAAARVQTALLPTKAPDVEGYEFAWAFRPSATLAGDLLNVFRLDERRVGFFVLDVSGHGVAAALLSVTISKFLSPTPDSSSILWRQLPGGGYELEPPARVADRLNKRFPFDDLTHQFLTVVYGVLDVERHELRFVSAGHPGVLVVPALGECRRLDGGGCPVGLSDEEYEEFVVEVGPGERVYLYSDGIPEARNASGEQWGVGRMISALCDGRGVSLRESVEGVCAGARGWSGLETPGDDQTVVAIGRVGEESGRRDR